MANYAIIENDYVTNVIVADSKEIAEQVTSGEVLEATGDFWIGWHRVNGVWVNPDAPVETPAE